jgi:hypothetical protein
LSFEKPTSGALMQLESLSLEQYEIEDPKETSIQYHLSVGHLRQLKLKNCRDCVKLTEYLRTQSLGLTSLVIISPLPTNHSFRFSLQQLLMSFTGLEHLELTDVKLEEITNGANHHAATLKLLKLDKTEWRQESRLIYSGDGVLAYQQDLQDIMESCILLEELHVYHSRYNLEVYFPFTS